MTASEFRTNADAFTKAYVEAALWSTSAERGSCANCKSSCVVPDPSTERCPTCGGRLSGTDRSLQDMEYDIEDISPMTLDHIVKECADFQKVCDGLITEENCLMISQNWRCEGLAGHDFLLTRNRHGAGFWETSDWMEAAGKKLTAAAHAAGECNLYIGDDNRIYQA